MGAEKSLQTLARVTVDLIPTGSTVLTWIRFAIVQIHVATFTSPSGLAQAKSHVEPINATTVDARIRRTEGLFDFASLSDESRRAFAREIVDSVVASGVQSAWLKSAIVDVRLALGTGPAWKAKTAIASEGKRLTRSTVHAWRNAGAWINFLGTAEKMNLFNHFIG